MNFVSSRVLYLSNNPSRLTLAPHLYVDNTSSPLVNGPWEKSSKGHLFYAMCISPNVVKDLNKVLIGDVAIPHLIASKTSNILEEKYIFLPFSHLFFFIKKKKKKTRQALMKKLLCS